MKKLSVFLIAALLIIIATRSAKADASLIIDNECGCRTSTPSPTAVPTPTPTNLPTPGPTDPPKNDGGLTPAGAPICTASQPVSPIVTSIVRKPASAIITWTKVANANHYLIFYGDKPGSEQFGVPDTGNVTTYTIGSLNPKLKYYFEVRAVNDCMPSKAGQVLGASTTALAATSSYLILPRLILGIITAGVFLAVVKKFNI